MALLHRSRYPRLGKPNMVPVGPIAIDWTHPLARGLVGCYVPGSREGYNDLCNNWPRLIPWSAATTRSTATGLGDNTYKIANAGAASPTGMNALWNKFGLGSAGSLFISGDYPGSNPSTDAPTGGPWVGFVGASTDVMNLQNYCYVAFNSAGTAGSTASGSGFFGPQSW